MKAQLLIFLLACSLASTARAQLDLPSQFYTNGVKINGWSRVGSDRKVSLLFAKYRDDDLAYRQQIVIILDRDPSRPLHIDPVTRKFIGRLDLKSGLYSLLLPEARREKLEDIPESAFPPPGRLPTIEQLFKQEGDGPGSQTPLMIAPPTAEYPRLETSSWDSNYTRPGTTERIKAKVVFKGTAGAYTLESGDVGQLSNVSYRDNGSAGYAIAGDWLLQGFAGTFEFKISRENVNAFVGSWTSGGVSGVWDGPRAFETPK